MSLASLTVHGRPAFDKGAIMRRAHEAGRFALAACRTAAERRAQMSRWLRKAWQEAKAQAYRVEQDAKEALRIRAVAAVDAARSAALAASYGSRAAVETALASEHMRDHADFRAIDRLSAALATFGA